ncbi:Charged multivesicular body protein 5 [Orchesella cincta]|uniref:Charged multivesicular body protein 5 n=1 Tax=Orchesella cincta TaxID=48709 RepID=A0A1D2NK64_ORCCI|nr:Charged multivesicular body protein 5 [Orchesella cincta]
MKRLVGLPKKGTGGSAAAYKPQALNDIVKSTDSKVVELDRKIEQCDAELRKINNQMKNGIPGISKRSLQEKARGVLVRKKRFEQQVEQLRDKSFNLDSLAMNITAAEDTTTIATVMQNGTKQLKKQLRKIDLDEIEQTQDDLADLMEMTDDIQAAVSKNYDVPQDIDDDELNSQLELLGDEIVADNDPSYIDAVLEPSNAPLTRKTSSKNRRGGGGGPAGPTAIEVDDYGLPILPIAPSEEKIPSTSEEKDIDTNTNKK